MLTSTYTTFTSWPTAFNPNSGIIKCVINRCPVYGYVPYVRSRPRPRSITRTLINVFSRTNKKRSSYSSFNILDNSKSNLTRKSRDIFRIDERYTTVNRKVLKRYQKFITIVFLKLFFFFLLIFANFFSFFFVLIVVFVSFRNFRSVWIH